MGAIIMIKNPLLFGASYYVVDIKGLEKARLYGDVHCVQLGQRWIRGGWRAGR